MSTKKEPDKYEHYKVSSGVRGKYEEKKINVSKIRYFETQRDKKNSLSIRKKIIIIHILKQPNMCTAL